MKKHTVILLSIITITLTIMSLCATSCKKNSSSTADSGIFYFHLHTNIDDSTIGGNPGPDSNTTGSNNPWYYLFDTTGPRILLTVPQFYVSNIMLANANGTMLSLNNVVLLKGLDSEDYYLCKVPVGTYTYAMFTVGLTSNTTTSPSTLFVTDGNPYPTESTMWTGSAYNEMIIQGLYDTTAAHTGVNPISFNFAIPNSSTNNATITLPTRGTGAYSSFPVYVLTSGGTQYVHILCDYAKLLSYINLKTSNQTNGTSINPSVADSLASQLTNMFRYEQ
jgi:hypothetical protein